MPSANLSTAAETDESSALAAAWSERIGRACYNSAIGAVGGWALENRIRSRDREYGALLYEIKVADGTVFSFSKTYKGMKPWWFIRANTLWPLLRTYFWPSFLRYGGKAIAWIHSHPDCQAGYHNDYPSKEDLFLLRLPRIHEVYVVPYKYCREPYAIICASERESWQH